jgi:hypothetical protein
MGDPTSSYATAGIALRVSGGLKPHHHDKVDTPLVGSCIIFWLKIPDALKCDVTIDRTNLCSGNT